MIRVSKNYLALPGAIRVSLMNSMLIRVVEAHGSIPCSQNFKSDLVSITNFSRP